MNPEAERELLGRLTQHAKAIRLAAVREVAALEAPSAALVSMLCAMRHRDESHEVRWACAEAVSGDE
jgi:hypothetical protein